MTSLLLLNLAFTLIGLFIMSAEFDALKAQVAATLTAEQSAIVLINSIAAQIAAASEDPAAVQALSDQLKASADALAAAVVAAPQPQA